MATKTAAIIQSGTSNYLTPAESFNVVATDLIIQGVAGSAGSTSGVAPSTGSFAVNAQGSPNMTVAVSAGQAYVNATPTSGNAQSIRVKLASSENVTIAANATGSTRYDFVYIKVDADKLNNPAADGTDVVTLVTQRSTTTNSDSNGALANGLLIAVVTVTNGASSIANSDIADCRMPITGASWQSANETWAYSSADSPTFVVTVPSDATGKYTVGMKVRLWQGSWKFFIITAVSSTTLTLYGGTDYTLTNAGISNPMYSGRRVPVGFPMDPTKWTVTWSSTVDTTISTTVQGTWYNIGSFSISIPIGAWNVSTKLPGYITPGSGETALSTANNSASDVNFRTYLNPGGLAQNMAVTTSVSSTVVVATKTPYYIVVRNNEAAGGTFYLFGLRAGNAWIKAVCAYL